MCANNANFVFNTGIDCENLKNIFFPPLTFIFKNPTLIDLTIKEGSLYDYLVKRKLLLYLVLFWFLFTFAVVLFIVTLAISLLTPGLCSQQSLDKKSFKFLSIKSRNLQRVRRKLRFPQSESRIYDVALDFFVLFLVMVWQI